MGYQLARSAIARVGKQGAFGGGEALGAAAARTKAIRAGSWNINPNRVPVDLSQYMGVPTAGNGPVLSVVEYEDNAILANAPMDVNQVLLACQSGLESVTPTTPPGATNTRVWTFDPDADAYPDIDVYTIEIAASDLEPTPNYDAVVLANMFCTGMVLQAPAGNGAAQFNATYMAAKRAYQNTVTGGLSPDIVLPVAAGRCKLERFTSVANALAGTSPVLADLNAFTITLNTGWSAVSDDKDDADSYTKIAPGGGRTGTLVGDVRATTADTAFYQAERQAAEDDLLRIYKATFNGVTAIETFSSTTTRYMVEVIFVGQHIPASLQGFGSNQVEGKRMEQMSLISKDDPTSNKSLIVRATNILTAYPA